MVQISHLYMTAEKTIALTIQSFVSKLMSLLFNTLSRFIIASLPRNKCLLFHGCSHHPQWFLEPKKISSVPASIFSPSICHEVMGYAVYGYHIFCICPSVDGHFGCFRDLPVVNSTARNAEVHASFQIRVFSGHMLRKRIAGSSYSMIKSWKHSL